MNPADSANRKRYSKVKKILTSILFFQIAFSANAVSIDYTLSKKILHDTEYFLRFLDMAVANFGEKQHMKTLIEANDLKFKAHLEYLQGNYAQSYKLVKRSQELLNNLYFEMVDIYDEDAEKLLQISAPIIVLAKDKTAHLFLRRGYRDLKSNRNFKKMGKNTTRFLYSKKIRYYIDSIKQCRRSKRYAFLALIESKTPLEEKTKYRTQTIDEGLTRTVDTEKLSDYNRVKNKLTNMINRKLFKNSYNFFLHHDDNYAFISGEKASILHCLYKKNRKETSAFKMKNDPKCLALFSDVGSKKPETSNN